MKLGRIEQLFDPLETEDIPETWRDYVPAALLFWILVAMTLVAVFWG